MWLFLKEASKTGISPNQMSPTAMSFTHVPVLLNRSRMFRKSQGRQGLQGQQ